MWHTTSTPAAIMPAATKPQSCEIRRTALTKRCVGAGTAGLLPWRWAGRAAPARETRALLDAQRGVDELLAVRHFLGELIVGALLGDLDPLVVLGRGERHHLDLVILEGPDHLVVQPLCFPREVGFRFLARGAEHVLLLLAQARQALLRHEHRLVHEPQRVVAGRGEALHLLVDAEGNEA